MVRSEGGRAHYVFRVRAVVDGDVYVVRLYINGRESYLWRYETKTAMLLGRCDVLKQIDRFSNVCRESETSYTITEDDSEMRLFPEWLF